MHGSIKVNPDLLEFPSVPVEVEQGPREDSVVLFP